MKILPPTLSDLSAELENGFGILAVDFVFFFFFFGVLFTM
jgi:hypothetical protein